MVCRKEKIQSSNIKTYEYSFISFSKPGGLSYWLHDYAFLKSLKRNIVLFSTKSY